MWKSSVFEWEARFNCDFGTGVVVSPFCSSLCCLSETGRFFCCPKCSYGTSVCQGEDVKGREWARGKCSLNSRGAEQMPYKFGYFSTLVFCIKFTFPLQWQSWAHKRWGWLKCWQAEHRHSRGPEGFSVVGNQSAGALVCSCSPLPRWCLLAGQEDFWKESRVSHLLGLCTLELLRSHSTKQTSWS